MRRRAVQHRMQGAFVFVLLGLFALMSALLVLLGARMYRNVTDRAESGNDARILSSYVRGMVRGLDAEDSVAVEDADGLKALALRQSIRDEEYVTRIYAYDGSLWEQFTRAERDFLPENGVRLISAESMCAEIAGGVLTVTMEQDGEEPVVVKQSLRSGGERGI